VEVEDGRDSETEGEGANEGIPEDGQPGEEDGHGADGEHQPSEAAAEAEAMHGDALVGIVLLHGAFNCRADSVLLDGYIGVSRFGLGSGDGEVRGTLSPCSAT